MNSRGTHLGHLPRGRREADRRELRGRNLAHAGRSSCRTTSGRPCGAHHSLSSPPCSTVARCSSSPRIADFDEASGIAANSVDGGLALAVRSPCHPTSGRPCGVLAAHGPPPRVRRLLGGLPREHRLSQPARPQTPNDFTSYGYFHVRLYRTCSGRPDYMLRGTPWPSWGGSGAAGPDCFAVVRREEK